ncbi:dihydrofolate reductase family protein [Vibrio sp. SCSIO 43137]|uniref:dihydrofolate reductase family protein n=1 Tax=Vibrio sp. SCSIO 43137 TaxID=3021011 RepID=UPI002307068A|nr:dihydrofolate reductase family protein [Vibrio sp. SCSIO 43137]WCE30832.1 dihydrofolate reductase family protein [Vibrio sp. SCSIO 43137]
MKFSVFIATSADGFIASKDGSLDWLHAAGNKQADMGDNADMGWAEHLASHDCLIMGRGTMEAIAAMNLTVDKWPYGDMKIIVLSKTLQQVPDSIPAEIELYSGDIPSLIKLLEQQGHQRAYVDGGKTIQSFLNHKLIDEMSIFRAPVLLGEGIPLFGKTDIEIKLTNAQSEAFANDFVLVKYKVVYS